VSAVAQVSKAVLLGVLCTTFCCFLLFLCAQFFHTAWRKNQNKVFIVHAQYKKRYARSIISGGFVQLLFQEKHVTLSDFLTRREI
jgi:hypothetical protein